jgi:septal ring factor EnvC (AmiA/AmiB activator)
MKLQVTKDQLDRDHCTLMNKQESESFNLLMWNSELQKNLTKTTTQLHQLKEELKTAKQQLGSLKSYAQVSLSKTHRKVDARKREKEANKLRDQLHKLSHDPKAMKRISFQSKALLSKPNLTKGNVKVKRFISLVKDGI